MVFNHYKQMQTNLKSFKTVLNLFKVVIKQNKRL